MLVLAGLGLGVSDILQWAWRLDAHRAMKFGSGSFGSWIIPGYRQAGVTRDARTAGTITLQKVTEPTKKTTERKNKEQWWLSGSAHEVSVATTEGWGGGGRWEVGGVAEMRTG